MMLAYSSRLLAGDMSKIPRTYARRLIHTTEITGWASKSRFYDYVEVYLQKCWILRSSLLAGDMSMVPRTYARRLTNATKVTGWASKSKFLSCSLFAELLMLDF